MNGEQRNIVRNAEQKLCLGYFLFSWRYGYFIKVSTTLFGYSARAT